jgi:hypothetical protein
MTSEEDKNFHIEVKQRVRRGEWQAAIDEVKNQFEMGRS